MAGAPWVWTRKTLGCLTLGVFALQGCAARTSLPLDLEDGQEGQDDAGVRRQPGDHTGGRAAPTGNTGTPSLPSGDTGTPEATPPQGAGGCFATGCWGERCLDHVDPECSVPREYTCYMQFGSCGRLPTGECGWIPSAPEMNACVDHYRANRPPHAGSSCEQDICAATRQLRIVMTNVRTLDGRYTFRPGDRGVLRGTLTNVGPYHHCTYPGVRVESNDPRVRVTESFRSGTMFYALSATQSVPWDTEFEVSPGIPVGTTITFRVTPMFSYPEPDAATCDGLHSTEVSFVVGS